MKIEFLNTKLTEVMVIRGFFRKKFAFVDLTIADDCTFRCRDVYGICALHDSAKFRGTDISVDGDVFAEIKRARISCIRQRENRRRDEAREIERLQRDPHWHPASELPMGLPMAAARYKKNK